MLHFECYRLEKPRCAEDADQANCGGVERGGGIPEFRSPAEVQEVKRLEKVHVWIGTVTRLEQSGIG